MNCSLQFVRIYYLFNISLDNLHVRLPSTNLKVVAAEFDFDTLPTTYCFMWTKHSKKNDLIGKLMLKICKHWKLSYIAKLATFVSLQKLTYWLNSRALFVFHFVRHPESNNIVIKDENVFSSLKMKESPNFRIAVAILSFLFKYCLYVVFCITHGVFLRRISSSYHD